MSDAPEELVWRRQLSSVWLYLLLAASSLMQVVSFVRRLVGMSRLRTSDTVSGILSCTLLAMCLSMLVLELARTRVRLSTTALEIRQYSTKHYPYSEITDARIDRGTNDRTIKVTLNDGRQIGLPAPTRGLRRPTDPTLANAVTAIRTRAGLPEHTSPLP